MSEEKVITELKVEKIGMWSAMAEVIYAIAKSIEKEGLTEFINVFRVIFRSFLATGMVGVGISFLWKAAFIPKELLNEHTGVIVGFITGTFIVIAITFYFGGQDRQKKQEPPINNQIGE